MNRNVRRKFAAWLLLLVFVPVMVATSLHIHEYEETVVAECEQCLHHVHHSGHIYSYTNPVADCVLCQFASLPFVAAIAMAIAFAIGTRHVAYVYILKGASLGVCDVKSTRAPPLF